MRADAVLGWRRCSRLRASPCCRTGRSSWASSLAGLALNIVPGADMTFIIASAARGGRRDGMIASLGVGAGALVHILAAVLGLSAILASSQAAFNAIKWIGAAYLLWIAFSLLRSGGAPKRRARGPPPRAGGCSGAAMLVNILNPKVALFFLAFLPQFVDPHAAMPALQILCLGLWFDLGRHAGQYRHRAGRGGRGGAAPACRLARQGGALARGDRDGRARRAARAQRAPSGISVGAALLQRLGISGAGMDALQPVERDSAGRRRGRRGCGRPRAGSSSSCRRR